MKAKKMSLKSRLLGSMVVMAALALVGATGCDLTGTSGAMGSGGDFWSYGWNDSYGDGSSDSFSISSGSNIGESLDNYFSSQW